LPRVCDGAENLSARRTAGRGRKNDHSAGYLGARGAARSCQIRVIEQVEHVAAELNLVWLADREPLINGEVQVCELRAGEGVARRVPVKPGRLESEGAGIEPKARGADRGARRDISTPARDSLGNVCKLNSRQQVGAVGERNVSRQVL